MKKIAYTIALVALFSVVCNAQDHGKKEAPAKKETVNPDGTTSPAKAEMAPATKEGHEHEHAKNGTRMAVTEKGVPAKKAEGKEAKKEEPAKAEKH